MMVIKYLLLALSRFIINIVPVAIITKVTASITLNELEILSKENNLPLHIHNCQNISCNA